MTVQTDLTVLGSDASLDTRVGIDVEYARLVVVGDRLQSGSFYLADDKLSRVYHNPNMPNSSIVCFDPKPDFKIRLFCLPYAGSGIAVFRPWLGLLPPSVQLCAVQLPGRESRLRESAFTRIEPLVEAVAQDIAVFAEQPLALFGHSMGALVCFELARQLRRVFKVSPVHLFLSGRRAPQLPDPFPPLANLPDAGLVQEIQRRYEGIPEVILKDPEMLEFFLPILRADLASIDHYSYCDEPPLDCPISCYAGADDPTVSRADVEAWRLQTSRTFSCQEFPGRHFYWQAERTWLPRSIGAALADAGYA